MEERFRLAKIEIGEKEFNERYRKVFNQMVLDYVETIVLNLPNSCQCDCEYCIDKYLRTGHMDATKFLIRCRELLMTFPNAKNVCITGGNLDSENFNELAKMIREYIPNAFVTWNTNGVEIDESYSQGIKLIDYVNLHRNSVSDEINRSVFRTNKRILTIEEAKKLFGDKLYLRVTVDKDFDLDEYADLEIPLYLNRMLPPTKETDYAYTKTLDKLYYYDVKHKRRNAYITSVYTDHLGKAIPVRICCGDNMSNHIIGRKPTYLNVAILHRSGVISGSWYEDDKLLKE